MQVRKLIRLLQEAQKKQGPYAEVMIGTRTYEKWNMEWTHDKVSDVELDFMEFVNSDGYLPDAPKSRPVIILNGY